MKLESSPWGFGEGKEIEISKSSPSLCSCGEVKRLMEFEFHEWMGILGEIIVEERIFLKSVIRISCFGLRGLFWIRTCRMGYFGLFMHASTKISLGILNWVNYGHPLHACSFYKNLHAILEITKISFYGHFLKNMIIHEE